jgi:poly(A) polymerase
MFDISWFTESREWPLIMKIARLLGDWNIQTYVVGGWIRDRLIGRDTEDIDLAVIADGQTVAGKLALALGGKYVQLDEANKIGRVVLRSEAVKSEGQLTIDVATCQESIEKDLARRDFTIDAMAIDVSESERSIARGLIDPFHGQKDLKQRTIRAVTETTFLSDPVRLLRAVRLASVLGFNIEPETEALLMSDASLITRVAGERVRDELLVLLSTADSGLQIEYLDKLHLLTAIFPELELSREFRQPPEHYWSVLYHSLRTVAALDYLLRQGKWQYTRDDVLNEVPWSEGIKNYFEGHIGYDSNRAALTRLAALFHDISKPKVMSVEPGGKVRFLGHAEEGAAIAVEMLERLRFSTREARFVEKSVKYHMRPTQMGMPEIPTNRAIYRYYRDTEDVAVAILFLSLADHLATRGPGLDMVDWKVHTQTVTHILSRRSEERERVLRLIDGYDIMSYFGLGPSPLVGELLGLVQEAQAAGEVSTKDEALKLIAQRLRARSGEHEGGEAN